MATAKQSLLLFFVALVAGVYISYSAFHVPLSRGRLHGRRVLTELKEKISLRPTHTFIEPRHTYSKRILGAQIEVQETGSVDDYGSPGRNPPYHEDPPTPFTMKSDHELTNLRGNLFTDYPPIGPSPPKPYYGPSLTTDNFDYAPLRPDPTNPDYGPPSNTDDFRTNYAPLGPNPAPENYDNYPPPAPMNFHSGNAV